MNASPASSEALTTPHPARLTIEDFLLLCRSGAFDRYAKTELISGAVTVVNAQFSEHLTAKVDLLLLLNEACNRLGTGLRVWSEGSVALGEDSMPEPDLFITDVRPSTGAVRPETVVLIVEVADTSLPTDLGEKGRPLRRARDLGILGARPPRPRDPPALAAATPRLCGTSDDEAGRAG